MKSYFELNGTIQREREIMTRPSKHRHFHAGLLLGSVNRSDDSNSLELVEGLGRVWNYPLDACHQDQFRFADAHVTIAASITAIKIQRETV